MSDDEIPEIEEDIEIPEEDSEIDLLDEPEEKNDEGDEGDDAEDFIAPRAEPKEELPELQLILVAPENRLSSDFIQSFEYTRVIAVRAREIEYSGDLYIKTNLTSSADIAKEEFKQGKIPYSIRRVQGKYVEIWPLSELHL